MLDKKKIKEAEDNVRSYLDEGLLNKTVVNKQIIGSVETLVKSIDVRGIVFHNTPSCGIRQQTYTTTSMLFVEHFYRAK